MLTLFRLLTETFYIHEYASVKSELDVTGIQRCYFLNKRQHLFPEISFSFLFLFNWHTKLTVKSGIEKAMGAAQN